MNCTKAHEIDKIKYSCTNTFRNLVCDSSRKSAENHVILVTLNVIGDVEVILIILCTEEEVGVVEEDPAVSDGPTKLCKLLW